MKREAIGNILGELIRSHHNAFLVELLGDANSGLTPEEIEGLLEAGVLDPAALGGITIEGLEHTVDPYEYLYLATRAFEGADPDTQEDMRDWSITDWNPRIDREYVAALEQPALPYGSAISVVIDKPPLDEDAADEDQEVSPPAWMAPTEKNAWGAAVRRAGSFARGLGNTFEENLDDVLAEEWAGEEIATEVQPAQRREILDIIQEETAREIEESKSARALARRLANRTEDYAHNWLRIARTELQGAFNEATVLYALEHYGDEAQVARVVESGACKHCLRLFQTSDGSPAVFPLADIVANGTNVGKPASSWQATIWPVHPNCRCDTVNVPPGMVILSGGRLRRRKEE